MKITYQADNDLDHRIIDALSRLYGVFVLGAG